MWALGARVATLVLIATTVVAQSPTALQSNPEEVFRKERVGALLSFVEYYCQYETQGGRLTDSGWEAAAPFFAHPVPPPHERTIYVVGDYGVGGGPEPVIKPVDRPTPDLRATAQVLFSTNSAIGKLDPSLGLTREAIYGFDVTYKLVLTDGNPAWKFGEEGSAIFIGIPTAILYVSLMREKTTDPAVRKNADATLAALKKMKPY